MLVAVTPGPDAPPLEPPEPDESPEVAEPLELDDEPQPASNAATARAAAA
jgi:hypothetical protein